jgi:hypothetical protein
MPRPAKNSPDPGISRDRALHAQGGRFPTCEAIAALFEWRQAPALSTVQIEIRLGGYEACRLFRKIARFHAGLPL